MECSRDVQHSGACAEPVMEWVSLRVCSHTKAVTVLQIILCMGSSKNLTGLYDIKLIFTSEGNNCPVKLGDGLTEAQRHQAIHWEKLYFLITRSGLLTKNEVTFNNS